jgi:hypothetical protein
MLKAIGAALKWVAFCFLPFYVGLFLLLCVFMALAGSFDGLKDMWVINAILCVPLAGMVAASQSIPPRGHH